MVQDHCGPGPVEATISKKKAFRLSPVDEAAIRTFPM